VGLIKVCVNETYSRIRIRKKLSDKFIVQNGLKQGDTLSPLLLKLYCNQEGPRETGRT
jgi:hypothetical protein